MIQLFSSSMDLIYRAVWKCGGDVSRDHGLSRERVSWKVWDAVTGAGCWRGICYWSYTDHQTVNLWCNRRVSTSQTAPDLDDSIHVNYWVDANVDYNWHLIWSAKTIGGRSCLMISYFSFLNPYCLTGAVCVLEGEMSWSCFLVQEYIVTWIMSWKNKNYIHWSRNDWWHPKKTCNDFVEHYRKSNQCFISTIVYGTKPWIMYVIFPVLHSFGVTGNLISLLYKNFSYTPSKRQHCCWRFLFEDFFTV